MAWCTKDSVDKIVTRGVDHGVCKVCGELVLIVGTGRSIHVFGMLGGFGEVRHVGEAYCPKCDRRPEPPAYGTPIQESLIVQVAEIGER